jgi:ketosteroid isomerase-like protein
MAAHSDTIARGYEAFGRGDFEGALGILSDDIEWQGPDSHRVPGHGVHHGKDEVRHLWQELADEVDGLRIEPDEFLEGEETVTVLGHTHGKGRSGEFKVPFVHVWRFEGGDPTPTRVQTLTDTAVLADALGN